MKFEQPPLHLNDDDDDEEGEAYLNAAYLCADFTHINGDQQPGGHAAATAAAALNASAALTASMTSSADLTAFHSGGGAAPAAPATAAIVPAAGNGDIETGGGGGGGGGAPASAQPAVSLHLQLQPQQQQHIVEQAVLRMVDIISSAVLTKRETTQQLPAPPAAPATAAAAAADADRSGDEPFLEYVRHYLRHTTPAANVELKRLVTQFMHSQPTNGERGELS